MSKLFLCATEGTATSASALRYAVELAEATGAVLVVLHVVEGTEAQLRDYAPTSRGERAEYEKQLKKRLESTELRIRRQLRELPGRRATSKIEVVVVCGTAVEVVLNQALRREASLIILGKGRKAGAIAATAERIASLSLRPVLMVPGRWVRGPRTRALRAVWKPRQAFRAVR